MTYCAAAYLQVRDGLHLRPGARAVESKSTTLLCATADSLWQGAAECTPQNVQPLLRRAHRKERYAKYAQVFRRVRF